MFKRLLAGTALTLTLAVPALARDNYALLVGVSEYPNLEEKYWLNGPRNDMGLVRDYLLSAAPVDFAPDHITLLADGVEGGALPTLGAIRDAFAELTAKAQPGDFIYLHFSGHGSQTPAADPSSELDGLDETFLPYDIGPWSDEISTVQNALVDDEIGQMLDALRATGADVWVVFDSCHSGTATRAAPTGDDPVSLRQLPPGALGIPEGAVAEAGTSSRGMGDPTELPPAPVDMPAATTPGQQGSLVAFFAAQTNETTPEMNLPKGFGDKKVQGVFTYMLFETLAERPGITYRQLAQEVLRKYSVVSYVRSTPLFEGDLDAVAFGGAATSRVSQWPLEVKADGSLAVDAGSLHGLSEGSTLLLVASPADGDDDALGTVTVTGVSTFKAVADTASLNGAEIPRGAYLRKASEDVDFSLTVALPDGDSEAAQKMRAALQVIEQDGLAGPRVRFVEPGAEADLRLAAFPDSFQPDAVWLLPGAGVVDDSELAEIPYVTTGNVDEFGLIEKMAENLLKTARATSLMKIGAASAGLATGDVTAELRRAKFDPVAEEVDYTSRVAMDATNVPRLVPNDVVGLKLENPTDAPLDYNILYIGADYSITFMDNGRMQPGAVLDDDYVLISEDNYGRDRMVVILTPADAKTAVTDLSFLEQDAVTRGVSAGVPQQGITEMFEEAGFGTTTRGAVSLSKKKKEAEAAPIVFQFELDTVPNG